VKYRRNEETSNKTKKFASLYFLAHPGGLHLFHKRRREFLAMIKNASKIHIIIDNNNGINESRFSKSNKTIGAMQK